MGAVPKLNPVHACVHSSETLNPPNLKCSTPEDSLSSMQENYTESVNFKPQTRNGSGL